MERLQIMFWSKLALIRVDSSLVSVPIATFSKALLAEPTFEGSSFEVDGVFVAA